MAETLLSQAGFSNENVATLQESNIRYVGQFLSLTDRPTGQVALTRVLGITNEQLADITAGLKAKFPDEIPPRDDGRRYAMGLRPRGGVDQI